MSLHFDLDNTVVEPYSVEYASSSYPSAVTSKKGSVIQKTVDVIKRTLDGPHDLKGRRVYFPYQPKAYTDDSQTTYNSASGK